MNKSVKKIFVLAIVVFFSVTVPTFSFWENHQIIEAHSNRAIKNLCADATGRCHDNLVSESNPGLERPGVDVWIAYLKETGDSTGTFSVQAKNYRFNNKYARDDHWTETQTVSTPNDLNCWGVSIESFLFASSLSGEYIDNDDENAGRGLPSAFVSFISETSALTKRLNLYRIKHDGTILSIALNVTSDNIDALSRTKVVKIRNHVLVFWDEASSTAGLRDIKMVELDATLVEQADGELDYLYSQKDLSTIVSDIPAIESLEFDLKVYPLDIKPRGLEQMNHRGILCWRSSRQTSILEDEIQAVGFEYMKATGFAVSSDYQMITSDFNLPTQKSPHILCETAFETTNDAILSTITWLHITGFNNLAKVRSVSFDKTATGWLSFEGQESTICEIDHNLPICTMGVDQGFMRPTSMDYDHENGKVGITQMANHRITIIDEPFESDPGCWIAEYYNKSAKDTGSMSRVRNNGLATEEIRQIGWVVSPSQENNSCYSLKFSGYAFPALSQSVLLPVAEEHLAGSYTNDIKEIKLIGDDFSSLYCFVVSQNPENGDSLISWICDGLLYRDSTSRDRLTRPYDMEFVPPVWTPTPTPVGVTPLPTHTPSSVTPTPCPEGIWIADMAGHRVVRINERGRVLAETFTEDVSKYTPVWSEYENFGVISPNDVSAAWDGSCWAIDWGRNEVVKIAANGHIVARTDACDAPDPDACYAERELIHPVSIDCGGDPNNCFVADYEGNRIYKITFDGTNTLELIPSEAEYYRPKVVTVDRYYDSTNQLIESIWVADRWCATPAPTGNATYTPLPSRTPTPAPGTPHAVPPTFTPYPEQQRVSQNQFGYGDFAHQIACSIPVALSVVSNADNDTYCYVSDRDAGWSILGDNYVRWVKIQGGNAEILNIGFEDGEKITRPVDSVAVGIPPTCTPTPTPTS